MAIKPNIELILATKRNEGYKIKTKDENGVEQEYKVNQSNLAHLLGITKQQFSLWVNNKSYPRAETLFELADLLQVKVDDLYTYEEDSPEEKKRKREKAKKKKKAKKAKKEEESDSE